MIANLTALIKFLQITLFQAACCKLSKFFCSQPNSAWSLCKLNTAEIFMRNSLSIFQRVFWWQEWCDYYFSKIPNVLEFLKRPKLVGKSGQFVSKKLAQKMKRKSQNGKVRKTIPIILSHKRSVNLRKSFVCHFGSEQDIYHPISSNFPNLC